MYLPLSTNLAVPLRDAGRASATRPPEMRRIRPAAAGQYRRRSRSRFRPLLPLQEVSTRQVAAKYSDRHETCASHGCSPRWFYSRHRALAAGCKTIGVNNRDLHTFRVDLNTSLQLAELIPPAVVKVAESGIESGDDIARLRQAGFDAFLVGESLMRAPRPGEALRDLLRAAGTFDKRKDEPPQGAKELSPALQRWVK